MLSLIDCLNNKYSLTLISEKIWALANSKFKIIASINIRLGHTLIG